MNILYDQEQELNNGVVLTKIEAKGLLQLLMNTDFTPTYMRFAAELGETLLKRGVR